MNAHHLIAQLLTTGVLVTVFLLLVLTVRPAFHRFADARWTYALWLSALVPVLMPLVPLSTPRFADRVVPTSLLDQLALEQSGNAIWWYLAGTVWIIGVLVSLARLSMQTAALSREISRHLGAPSETLRRRFERTCSKAGVHPPPPIRQSGRVGTPVLFGFANPVIVIPADFDDSYSRAEQELMLFHEIAHYRRRDPWWNLLFQIGKAIFWFTPFLSVAEKRFRADQERACDFWVLCDEPNLVRGQYASAIVKTVASNRSGANAATFRSPGSDILERTAALADHRRSLRRSLSGAAGIAVLLILAVQITPRLNVDPYVATSGGSWCGVYSNLGL